MSTLLAIDPSKPGGNTGVAWFKNAQLMRCWIHNDQRAPTLVSAPDVFVYEQQYITPADIRGSAAVVAKRMNDLMQLQRCNGQWEQAVARANALAQIHAPYPVQWKGSVDKEVHNDRVLKRLTPAEREVIPKLPKSKLHNVIDAIGLGLWALGRMQQEREAG
jgi:hypothetical protein